MKTKASIVLSVAMAGYSAVGQAAVVTNLFADPGFESLTGNQPNTNTAPWFSSGESGVGSVITSTAQKHSGNQSVVWQFYFDGCAILQNLGKQLDASKAYEMSAWLLTGEKSTNAAHTNSPVINMALYASTNGGISYAFVTTVLGGMLNSTTNVWQKFSASVDGATLPDWAIGGDTQLRFNKPNDNVTHRIYIDDTLFVVTESLLGYAPWASDWGVDIGTKTNDLDADSFDNLLEYALGGDPTNSLDQGFSSSYRTLEEGGTHWFEYVYPRRSDPYSGLAYWLELNDDPSSNAWVNAGYTVTGINPSFAIRE